MEVDNMERKIEGGLRTRTQFGVAHTFGNILRRIAPVHSSIFEEGIASGMLMNKFLPYEATETYRRIKAELDREKAKSLVEAHVQFFGAF
jgi:hypothetical protein